MVNTKHYNRNVHSWKRTDDIFVKKQKICMEIEKICLENNNISKQEVIEVLIADYRGQISNNNFVQFIL